MSLLKSLTFCPAAVETKNPILDRRLRLIARLEEQKRLAADPSYTVTLRRSSKGPDGERSILEINRKVRPWWKRNASGQLVLTVRNGLKPIEFEKGKAGIVIDTDQKLPSIVDTLIKAVGLGELDQYLKEETAVKPRSKADATKRA